MNQLKIGWAQADITPTEPVLLLGQFHARIAEGVGDPLTATVLVLDGEPDSVIMISCDLALISDELRAAVVQKVAEAAGEIPIQQMVISATHTHSAPPVRPPGEPGSGGITWRGTGVELNVMSIEAYVAFAAERIAAAVCQAWSSRSPGTLAYGEDFAVVGRNRRWTRQDGSSVMYGNPSTPDFSHIEGSEDHSVNILATRDAMGTLTGLVVNLACPSQVSESSYELSADFWCETRAELRNRLGDQLFVLGQCSSAGDLSPRPIYANQSVERMRQLRGRTVRQEIAHRIADAAERTLVCLGEAFEVAPPVRYLGVKAEVPLAALTEEDAEIAKREVVSWQEKYESELAKINADPGLRDEPRWYTDVTRAFGRCSWWMGVVRRYEQQAVSRTKLVDLHVLRIGDVAMASHPFELYLDFGIAIKARSKAMQTFLVQLAGEGGYTPSERSVAGGGYGSMPASTPVGPEGGRLTVEKTLEAIDRLFAE